MKIIAGKGEAATATSGLGFPARARTDEQSGFSVRTLLWILVSAAGYYLATRAAWVLCFPDSKVSLFFPPHAVLVSVLLLVPTRHWWAYTLAAVGAHFFATQQENWPTLYALQCEAFDALKVVLTAAGIRTFIKSPFHLISLREAIIFVLVAVVIVPFGTAFWGAAFTVANHFGTSYWIEWRNLGISNAVTTMVLVPAILVGVQVLTKGFKAAPTRILEACFLAAGILAAGWLAFDRMPAGPDTSPALLYAPIPLLTWAALRFGLGGISGSVLVITMLAIWGTMQGNGPFLTQSPEENALALQMFMLMAATPLMLLSVAIEDERRSTEALRFSEERMSLAAESGQMALWDWDVANDRVWITDEGRKFFGFEPGEPIQFFSNMANLGGRIHPDDSAMRAAAIRQALETRRTLRGGVSHLAARWLGALDRVARSPQPCRGGRAAAHTRHFDGRHAAEAGGRRGAAAARGTGAPFPRGHPERAVRVTRARVEPAAQQHRHQCTGGPARPGQGRARSRGDTRHLRGHRQCRIPCRRDHRAPAHHAAPWPGGAAAGEREREPGRTAAPHPQRPDRARCVGLQANYREPAARHD